MRISDLKYDIKIENIASEPPEVRLGSRDLGRLMVVDRGTGHIEDKRVLDLPTLLAPGDLFVINNSKRVPGVLQGYTSRGAQVEIRFAGLDDERQGSCQIYPDHQIEPGIVLQFGEQNELRVVSRAPGTNQLWIVCSDEKPLKALLKDCGHPITSFFSKGFWQLENYNNFYATEEGSVESPMAGIHLTPRLLQRLQNEGISIASITLHAYGSWIPILKDELHEHVMPTEQFNIPEETVVAVNEAKANGKRIIACGSTVIRTLESSAQTDGSIKAGAGKTNLFITPGYKFRVVDCYFTNFHTYRSSLMVLDASICDITLLKTAYQRAAETGYLFHEFGDAILYR